MKKLIGVMLSCLLIGTSLFGCAGTGSDTSGLAAVTQKPELSSELSGDSAGMPNPVVEVGSVDEINSMIGCRIKSVLDVYEGITEEGFSVINGEPKIGEYRFMYQGIPVEIRAGVAEGDISGIYMSGASTPDAFLTDGNPYAVVDTGYGLWTRWFHGGMQYAVRVGTGQDPSQARDGSTLEDLVLMFRDYQAYFDLPWYLYSEEDLPESSTDRIGNMLRDRQMMRELNAAASASFGTGDMIPFSSLEKKSSEAVYANSVTVSSVDELLAAIAPDTEIILKAGDYLLTDASDYGTGVKPYYVWENAWDGFQLRIKDVSHLSIRGEHENDQGTIRLLSTLLAESRYAIVLQFTNCNDVHLSGLVVGHTEQGECTGAVVDFNDCSDVSVQGSELFGCGTFGITAEDTKGILAQDTIIHTCSYGHLEMYRCSDIVFDKCSFFETSCWLGNLFSECRGVRFEDCDFAYNSASRLFIAEIGTDSVELNNCLFAYNNMEEGLFAGNTGKFHVRGGAYIDYSMDFGQYEAVPAPAGNDATLPAITPTPEPGV